MRPSVSLLGAAALFACLGGAAQAQQVTCGGDFNAFVADLKADAVAQGFEPATAARFFEGVQIDPTVLRADRRQGIFQDPFITFSRKLISQNRFDKGLQMKQRHADTFARIEGDYGIAPGVLLAFWAFETDYGSFQGDFNTLNALVTLSHDCRRPELFRPQIFAALQLFAQGDFDPMTTTGAWAGEIGMVQMLPKDILENGVDGDGDGHVSLKTSAADALMSGAKMLSHLGWRANEPWLQEVVLPQDMDWFETGLHVTKPVAEWAQLGLRARTGSLADGALEASVILPQGRHGPAFIAYPNFSVYFEWNQSFTYVLTAAYFGTRLQGAPIYDAGAPDAGLSGDQMKRLQQKLQERGYDVGDIDGILGAGTRDAVRHAQRALGLPADAWPTPDLLNRL
ncbi:lytic murein transglycosylase [Sagittula sp. SSi028]|uniref:lytic murein transglycosylase n=1 Tax=Sagittula sp. SSi028 TaxID=3400636 RepID=UPI003AF9CC5C